MVCVTHPKRSEVERSDKASEDAAEEVELRWNWRRKGDVATRVTVAVAARPGRGARPKRMDVSGGWRLRDTEDERGVAYKGLRGRGGRRKRPPMRRGDNVLGLTLSHGDPNSTESKGVWERIKDGNRYLEREHWKNGGRVGKRDQNKTYWPELENRKIHSIGI
ncbi:hypothetical protein B0H11DRAFT_2067319 [Mycena galericulata]|nr:hypothetical protein B0H11DRAFT_2067319 [Mycena galericulata]